MRFSAANAARQRAAIDAAKRQAERRMRVAERSADRSQELQRARRDGVARGVRLGEREPAESLRGRESNSRAEWKHFGATQSSGGEERVSDVEREGREHGAMVE